MKDSPRDGKEVWDVKKLLEVRTIRLTKENETVQLLSLGFFFSNIQMLRDHASPFVPQQFSQDIADNASKVCLAHLFTYQDFDEGTLGLAYVAPSKPQALGGLCPKRKASVA